MRVTGERVATAAKAERAQVNHAPKTAARKAKTWEDGFEAAAEKTKRKKKEAPKAPVAVSPTLVDAGSRALERDRTAPTTAVREAAALLGGLTAALVVSVLHDLAQPSVVPSRATQRIGELTGALFIEWLATHFEPEAPTALDRLAGAVDGFSRGFEQTFGLTPLEATRRFVDFIASTEGDARQRLRGTIYAA